MRRRKFIAATGASIVGLAGCASNEEETAEAEGNNGEDETQEQEDTTEKESSDTETTEESSGSLEITEHEFYEEDYEAGVRGIVANNTDETLDYVQVQAWFYNADGTQIGDSLDNTNNLEAGQEWAFTALLINAEPDEVEDYEIEASDSPA